MHANRAHVRYSVKIALGRLLKQLLCYDISKRATIPEIISSDWLRASYRKLKREQARDCVSLRTEIRFDHDKNLPNPLSISFGNQNHPNVFKDTPDVMAVMVDRPLPLSPKIDQFVAVDAQPDGISGRILSTENQVEFKQCAAGPTQNVITGNQVTPIQCKFAQGYTEDATDLFQFDLPPKKVVETDTYTIISEPSLIIGNFQNDAGKVYETKADEALQNQSSKITLI